jgi:hypothetical protein
MPLEFRGPALFDPASRSIRFAGFPNSQTWQTRVVICQITKDALQGLARDDASEPDRLLAAFERHAQTIHELASSEFDSGNWRPTITEEMVK